MAQESMLECKGLHSAPNPHSASPRGSLVKADNTVIRYSDVLEPRRGQKFLEDSALGDGYLYREGAFYDGVDVRLAGNGTLFDVITSAGATLAVTPVDDDALRMKFVEIAGNLYFNTLLGLKLIESSSAIAALNAGVPPAFDDFLSGGLRENETSFVSGSTGWMPGNTACAYRYVWGIKDANENIKLGAPGPAVIVRNKMDAEAGMVIRTTNVVTVDFTTKTLLHKLTTGDMVTLYNTDGSFAAGIYGPITVTGPYSFTYPHTGANATSAATLRYAVSRDTGVTPLIPPGITESNFVRIYRTDVTESADDAPSQEFFLVFERLVTSAEITAGYMLPFYDNTPSSRLDEPAYWNPNTGDGEVSDKFIPPVGKDMCLWDERLWLFNTHDLHRFHLRILGVGTPDGVQSLDTITINDIAFHAGPANAFGSREFALITDLESQSENIRYTAINMVNCLNYASNSAVTNVIARYESGTDGDPGKILLEEISHGTTPSGFDVYASRPASWGPALTTSSTGAQRSTNDERPHGASFSEPGEPEAFPLTNWLPVAVKGVDILRAVPFRDKMFVFASNRKIYSIAGPYPYRVDELDGSALLIAPDSVVVHSNQVMALTDQGVGVLTDSGLRIVSKDIEDDLLDVLALDPAVVKKLSFGVTYESERQYMVWVPTSDDADACSLGFVWNSLLDKWTRWTGERTFGRVSPYNAKLYMGDATPAYFGTSLNGSMRQERKTLDRTDFADEDFELNISAVVSSTRYTLTSVTGLSVGDLLEQSESKRGLVTAINGTTVTIVAPEESLSTGTVTVYVGIPCETKYQPVAPGGPCAVKNFRDITMHFADFSCHGMEMTFDTETYAAEGSAVIKPYSGYGGGGFGEGPFGNPSTLRNRRIEVTRNHNQAAMIRVGFRVREAFSQWALHGWTLNYEGGGDGGRP